MYGEPRGSTAEEFFFPSVLHHSPVMRATSFRRGALFGRHHAIRSVSLPRQVPSRRARALKNTLFLSLTMCDGFPLETRILTDDAIKTLV